MIMDLSVIIPAYNCESSIGKCLGSILDEKYISNYEIIIVNDGSEDSTGQICEQYKSKYPNIKLINKDNGGVSSARNAGLDIAKGKHIIFIDSDDYTEKNIIEYIFARIDKIGELVLFDYDLVSRNGEHSSSGNTHSSNDYDFVFREIVTQKLNGPFGKIFQNDIIQKNNIRFNENISLGEDLEFLLRYYVMIKTVENWDMVLYHYVYTENSITTKKLSVSDINDYCLAYECEVRTLEKVKNRDYKYILMESYIRVLFRKILISKRLLSNIGVFRKNYNRNSLINEIFSEKYPLKTQIKKIILKLLIK